MKTTRHALTRMAQRAIREDDLKLILWEGTEVEDGYFMRAKDCQSAERQLKRFLHPEVSLADGITPMGNRPAERQFKRLRQRVRRLQDKRVMVVVGVGDRIVTVYHASARTERRLLLRKKKPRTERHLLLLKKTRQRERARKLGGERLVLRW